MRRSDCIGNILWHMNLSRSYTGSRQRRIIPQRRFRISISITPIRHHPFGAGYRFAKDPTPFLIGSPAQEVKAKQLWLSLFSTGLPVRGFWHAQSGSDPKGGPLSRPMPLLGIDAHDRDPSDASRPDRFWFSSRHPPVELHGSHRRHYPRQVHQPGLRAS